MGGVRVSVPGMLNHRFMLPQTIPLSPCACGLLVVDVFGFGDMYFRYVSPFLV